VTIFPAPELRKCGDRLRISAHKNSARIPKTGRRAETSLPVTIFPAHERLPSIVDTTTSVTPNNFYLPHSPNHLQNPPHPTPNRPA